MNGKIYLIIEGVYSDWQIKGYHTDKEEALLICKKHNDSLSGKFSYQDEWYVIESEHINAPAEDKTKVDFVYCFAGRLEKPEEIQMMNLPDCVAKGTEKSNYQINTLPYSRKHALTGKIVLDHIDDQKAKKIMFDMIAQAKAEINGII